MDFFHWYLTEYLTERKCSTYYWFRHTVTYIVLFPQYLAPLMFLLTIMTLNVTDCMDKWKTFYIQWGRGELAGILQTAFTIVYCFILMTFSLKLFARDVNLDMFTQAEIRHQTVMCWGVSRTQVQNQWRRLQFIVLVLYSASMKYLLNNKNSMLIITVFCWLCWWLFIRRVVFSPQRMI